MTLVPFPPEVLDALALRLLDLAAVVRGVANSSREGGLDGVELHAGKVHEWLDRLEEWAHDSAARLEAALHKERGARRARELAAQPPPRPAGKRGPRRKPRG